MLPFIQDLQEEKRMNYSVFRFTLNMHNHRSQVAIPVFLGDTGIRLLISITDGGNPYIIEDGCTAYIRGKKPDGKGIFNPCLILNNTMIQYDFTEQTSNREGITTCEIELYGKDGTLITAPKFIIVVDSRSLSDSEIAEIIEDSDSEVGIIPKIIASVASEESRVEAEEIRKANELERQAKETERQANEVKRIALYEGVNNSVANLESRVTNLENKALSFVTDTDVGYTKDVPENALPYAAISKIGGMTRKCTNLWGLGDIVSNVYAYYIPGFVENLAPNKQYTLAWKYSSDGTLDTQNMIVIYAEVGTVIITNGVPFTVSEAQLSTIQSIYAYFGSDMTSGSMTNIMLNEGSTALPYEPHFSGLRDAKVTEVKSVGANLLNKDSVVLGYGLGENGYPYEDSALYYSAPIPVIEGEIYSLKNIWWVNAYSTDEYPYNGNYVATLSGDTITIPVGAKFIRAIGSVNGSSNVSTSIVNKGTTLLPYSPYTEHTLAIP
jgi:hypothetical protein